MRVLGAGVNRSGAANFMAELAAELDIYNALLIIFLIVQQWQEVFLRRVSFVP